MSRIPQTFIDELMARVDVVEVVGERVPLKKAGKEFKACCPFHGEKTPSFTVSPAKQFYHCFGCGAHGTALGFLMEHDHLDFVEAVEELARQAGLEVPREAGTPVRRPADDLYSTMARITDFYQRQLRDNPAAIAYLKRRGLDGETAARFGIGYAPDAWDAVLSRYGQDTAGQRHLSACGLIIERDQGGWYDRFRHRIMFPIRDARGRTVGFGGRVIDEGEPKYLNSPETSLFHKGQELYGLYEARQALRDIPRLLVVEGYMDVVGLSQAGIHWSVATLGTATTEEHLRRLFRVTDTVVFCFDGDSAGRKAAWRALENALATLREGHQLLFLFLPEGADPDSLVREEGPEALLERLDLAMPLSDFLLETLSGQVDMDTMDGRARMAELARPLMRRIPEGIYRDLLTRRLADRIGLSEVRLASILEGDRPQTPVFRPATRGSAQPPNRRSTLVRQAVTLILHHPGVVAGVEVPDALSDVDLAGMDLLLELLEVARSRPEITTGGLLERWRENSAQRHLLRLASSEMLTSSEAAPGVLGDTLREILRREGPERRTERLLEKARSSELSDAEKEELRRLLGSRAEQAPLEGQ